MSTVATPEIGLSAPSPSGAPPPDHQRAAEADRASKRRREWREYGLFALFVAPNLLLLGVFSYWPLFQNITLSFTEWDMIAPEKRFSALLADRPQHTGLYHRLRRDHADAGTRVGAGPQHPAARTQCGAHG